MKASWTLIWKKKYTWLLLNCFWNSAVQFTVRLCPNTFCAAMKHCWVLLWILQRLVDVASTASLPILSRRLFFSSSLLDYNCCRLCNRDFLLVLCYSDWVFEVSLSSVKKNNFVNSMWAACVFSVSYYCTILGLVF